MRCGALTLWLSLACACGGSSVHTVPRAPSVALYELAPVVERLPLPVTVAASGSDDYYAQPPVAATEDPLFEAIRAALPATDLVHDTRLDVIASEVAQIPTDVRATRGLLDFELDAHGIAEPLVGVAGTTDGDPATVVAAVSPQLSELTAHGWISLGIAHSRGRAVVIVAHRPRFFGERIPSTMRVGDRVEIAGTLAPEYRSPDLTIARGAEPPHHATFGRRGDRYSTSISCTRSSTLWLTITARDRLGDEPILASFPIACGREAVRSYVTEVVTAVDSPDVGARLASLVNRNRAAAGVEPLARDVRAERAAMTWAIDMSRASRVAHAIEGVTSTSRLREHGLAPARSSHLAFHADDLQQAIELLENDDTYRALLLDRGLTHAGIGIVPDPHGGFYAAIELAQIPPRVDAAAEQTRLLAKVRDVLGTRYRPWGSQAIDAIALWYATELALGWSSDSLDLLMKRKISSLRAPPFRVVVRTPVRIEDLDVAALVPEGFFHHVAVQVVQSPANSALANRIVVVMLFGG